MENNNTFEIGKFNELEGIVKKHILGKSFKVMEDSRRNKKYIGKTVIIDDKYNYGCEKDEGGKENYVGDVVWTHLKDPPKENTEENITFYLRELKPLEKIENSEFLA